VKGAARLSSSSGTPSRPARCFLHTLIVYEDGVSHVGTVHSSLLMRSIPMAACGSWRSWAVSRSGMVMVMILVAPAIATALESITQPRRQGRAPASLVAAFTANAAGEG